MLVICEMADKCHNEGCEHIVAHKEKNDCVRSPCGDIDFFTDALCIISVDVKNITNARW